MTTEKVEAHLPRQLLVRLLHRASLIILLLLALLLGAIRVYPAQYLYPALPKLTHTSGGAVGDPLNVLIVGDKAQIVAAFSKAGWLVPDPITPATSARIAADSLAHRPYPTAPVSKLYVFGRIQDLAFEWPTNDVQTRGHIRLWQAAFRLAGQPLWLGAASYDHGIELSGRTGFPTHHILPAVDRERDTVGGDLARTGLVLGKVYDPFMPPIFVAYNGGGDYYASDGQVLVIAFSHIALPAPVGTAALDMTLDRAVFQGYGAILSVPWLAIVTAAVGIGLITLALWPILSLMWLRVRAHVDRGGDGSSRNEPPKA